MSDIVARLHAMIDANYGDVAADSVYGSAMSDAADEITRLRAALRLLHDNVVTAWPSVADLGPVANARAALGEKA